MDIWWITVKIAFNSLFRNKMRSALTMLGIIIGVGTIVALLAITNGAKKNILGVIQSLGDNTIYILASSSTKGGVRGGFGSIKTLKPSDVEAIKRYCPHVKYASSNITFSGRAINREKNWEVTIIGGNENIQNILDWPTRSGNFFDSRDVSTNAKVCVIGTTVLDNLFDSGENPIGKTIRLNRIPFKIIGVMKKKGTSGMEDRDNSVFIPSTTMMERFYKKDYLDVIIVSAVSREGSSIAQDEITQLLRQRHKIFADEDDDFEMFSQEEIIEMVNKYSKMLTLLLGAVASISLLVGGIGIMNIMLVSVTERIREIGIRMAIGARRRDILKQFLIEAITLSISGGLIGIIFGFIVAYTVRYFTKWEVAVSIFAMVLAISFSSIVGIAFGFYPAWKASKLDPIEALRHE